MRSKNQKTMDEIVKIIEEFRMERGETPSLAQIAEKVHISRSSVLYYLRDMDERGIIEYSARKMETPLTQKIRPSSSFAPVVGSVRCGEPTDEVEEIEGIYSLPNEIFGEGTKYILRAVGDSMVDAGIDDGDLVVINKHKEPHEGDIVVAQTEDNTYTLKELGKYDSKSGKVKLFYRNESAYPEKYILAALSSIQGVAKHVIKAL